MNKLTGFKKIAACTVAVLICASVFSGAGSVVMNAEKAQAQSAELKENQSNISDTKSDIEELIAKQEELDKKIAETKDNIDSEEENKKAIEEQITTVQRTIMALTSTISQTNDEITALEQSIAEKEVQVNEKHEQIVEGVGEFKERLKAMYVAGNNSYSDIIIGSSDFYDMLMKMELVKRVAEHDDKMIDDLIVLKDQYEADEAELNAEKTELETKQAELETQKKAHENQRDKLQVLFEESQIAIDELSSDQEIYKNNLAMIEQDRAEFEKHLEQLYMERMAIQTEEKRKADEEKARQEEARRKEEERKKKEEEEKQRLALEKQRQEEEEAARKKAEADAAAQQADDNSGSGSTDDYDTDSGSTNTDTPADTDDGDDDTQLYIPPTASDNLSKNAQNGYVEKSRFTWPVPGHYNVSSGFGYRNWGVLVGYHGGIDIWDSNIYNAEIVAADAGTVIDVSNYCPHDYGKSYSCGCGGGYGRYCIIEHSDGYWTLYGHANNIVVSVGQYVEKGQVLGYVGSTGHSTGPHTHFEVRLNGERQDPQNYV